MADDSKNWRHSFAGLPLAEIVPADELLHPAVSSGHYSSTETSYYGFSVPERKLNGEIYLWFHPVLRVHSASVYIWTGIKSTNLSCEYVNHHHYLPWPEGQIDDYTIEATGMRIRVLDPLKTIEITYSDEVRGVSFSFVQEAIMPAAGRPGGFHFTQAMKTKGWLNLYGEQIAIEGYFSRDRSWSQERKEDPMPLPPLSWTVGIFNDDFAFHLLAHDDPALDPEWADDYPQIQPGGALYWGYIWKDGILSSLKSAQKRTYRDDDGLSPTRMDIEMLDVDGRSLSVTGEVQARIPWQIWQNMNTHFCQTRWSADGLVGYGDIQDIQFNDFVRKFVRG